MNHFYHGIRNKTDLHHKQSDRLQKDKNLTHLYRWKQFITYVLISFIKRNKQTNFSYFITAESYILDPSTQTFTSHRNRITEYHLSPCPYFKEVAVRSPRKTFLRSRNGKGFIQLLKHLYTSERNRESKCFLKDMLKRSVCGWGELSFPLVLGKN